jgi:predicted TIM-barrel fold metal-dependent hydrolase
MIVDAHLHIWRRDTTYPNPTQTIVSPFSDIPVELLKEYMLEHGVDRAVLVQPLYPGKDNSYVADCAQAEPDRFAAVCIVDPNQPDAPKKLAYWVNERGCKGLRLRPALPQEDAVFGSAASYPLWEQIRSLGITVNLLANPQHLSRIDKLVVDFPDVDIIIDHMAHPNPATGPTSPEFQALLDLAKHPRVYVKATGYYYYSQTRYPYEDCWDLFRALHQRFGASRLIWGSDFPHVLLTAGYRRTMLLQERYYPFLMPDELDNMMGRTASRLYWK